MSDDEKLIALLKGKLAENPLLTQKVLSAVADSQADFIKAVEARRLNEASLAILDLISALMDRSRFTRMPLAQQQCLLKRVIEYHFPNGIHGHASCEIEFFEKYAEKKS